MRPDGTDPVEFTPELRAMRSILKRANGDCDLSHRQLVHLAALDAFASESPEELQSALDRLSMLVKIWRGDLTRRIKPRVSVLRTVLPEDACEHGVPRGKICPECVQTYCANGDGCDDHSCHKLHAERPPR